MGPQSTRATIEACARGAEAAGLDDIWVVDHIAIPPDDAEGSGGRYLDPLATLAFLVGVTERVRLGTAILNLPYRPPLPTAKAIATIQELSGGRLQLGIGIGWMEPEFKALGVDRRRRGAISDETLDFLHTCFANDKVVAHGQEFLFRPRPARPPIFIGGSPPHALQRTVRYGDGWMPMAGNPDKLAPQIEILHKLCAEAGKPPPEVAVVTGLPLADAARSRATLARFQEIGVTRVISGSRYADADEFRAAADSLADIGRSLG
jgi:probable F420-dependent oxidoreductase